MSDQKAQDIASFFDKEQSKKKKQQTNLQQAQQKKAEEQRKKAEEEKKAAKTANGDFESSDEEVNSHIDIGAGKVKDIKEVKKEKQLAKDAQRANDFKWDSIGGGMTASTAAASL
jgi:hypothetical protein